MVSNLSNKASERDLKEILRSCGKIRNCKIIRDSHTNRSKGIAYVEFYDIEPVNKACDLTGKKLLGHSMIIETSQAEKNREYAAHSASQKAVQSVGGKQVRIENLHKEITSANLRDIFSHFGTITNCQITPDKSSVNNTNLAFLTFSTAANARAMATSLDGFELVNLKLRITQLTDTSSHSHRSVLDSDIVDRGGVNLGKIGRFELMAKLAEGSGLRVPNIKANSSTGIGQNKQTAGLSTPTSTGGSSVKSMTSQCIVISNFFDSTKKELSDSEIRTIKDEVISVINNSGGCFHVSVDRKSIDGNVFAKCQTVGSAASAYQAFNGKTYNGRQLSAIYLPIASYHELFPESAHSFSLLSCSSPKSLPSNA
ncbi:MAG: RNA-binding protein 39 [Marteilia pararefringens]